MAGLVDIMINKTDLKINVTSESQVLTRVEEAGTGDLW